MSMNITIDIESIEDPKSRKHRIDADMVSEQPQGKVTLAEIQMDPYKLLAVNFDKAQRSCVSSLLTFNNQKLYSGEGSMSENVQSFRMLIWAIQGLANQCWACNYLAAVPEHLAGADRYTREAMIVCPGLPLSERVALYSLLLQLTCGMARSMLQMSAPAGVTSMQTDGITAMMELTTYVFERTVPMQLEMIAELRVCQFSDTTDPRTTTAFFENHFSILDFITPVKSRMTDLERDKLVWSAVPMHQGRGVWTPVRNQISEMCKEGTPPRQLVYSVMNTYWGRNISAPSIPASEVRHVNSMGKLVSQGRTTRHINTGTMQSYGGQQGYARMDTHGACSQYIGDDCETGIAATGLQDGHTYEDQSEEPEEHAAFGNEHG
jgi:hypothetical protein